MNLPAGIPRSRGAVCGVVLVLLGLWGGLAPFVGPYFHFGFTPDKAWAYNSGRLYYSAVPGAAVLLAGLLVLLTRNRPVGVIGGLVAVLGGAWFALGDGFVTVVLKQTSISIGGPIGAAGTSGFAVTTGGVVVPIRAYLEQLALFAGLGLLIVAVGALAIGRFSMLAARDLGADEEDSYAPGLPINPVPMRVVATAATPFASESDQYSPTGTFTRPSSIPPPALFPDSPPPFQDAPTQYPEPTS
jgi:hypothetical protein